MGSDMATSTAPLVAAGTDQIDLGALRRREPAAFEALVRSLSPRLLATARSIVGDARAEDVLQEAWISVHGRIDAFEGRSALTTWVTRIVVNKALSARRAERSRSPVPASDQDPSAAWYDDEGSWHEADAADLSSAPDDILEAEALDECLATHIANLPERQRIALTLRDLEQWSMEQVCNELAVSASNGRVLLHRARMRLLDMVKTWERTGSC